MAGIVENIRKAWFRERKREKEKGIANKRRISVLEVRSKVV
jgi:hypothetical protein